MLDDLGGLLELARSRRPAARARRGRRRGTAGRTPTHVVAGRAVSSTSRSATSVAGHELALFVEAADLHQVEHHPPREVVVADARAPGLGDDREQLAVAVPASPACRRRVPSAPAAACRRRPARRRGRSRISIARRAWWIASRWRARRICVAAARRHATAASNGRPAASRWNARRSGGGTVRGHRVGDDLVQGHPIGVQQRLVGRLGDECAGEALAPAVAAQHAGADHRGDAARPSARARRSRSRRHRTPARARPGAGPGRAPGRGGRGPPSTSRTGGSARYRRAVGIEHGLGQRLHVQRDPARPVGDLVEGVEPQTPTTGDGRPPSGATPPGRADRARSGRRRRPRSRSAPATRVVTTNEARGEALGEGVEEVERRRIGGCRRPPPRAPARRAPAPPRAATMPRCSARRRREQLGHHRAQRVQRRGAGGDGRSTATRRPDRAGRRSLHDGRLADPGRPADDDRHELRRRPGSQRGQLLACGGAADEAVGGRHGRRSRRRRPARTTPSRPAVVMTVATATAVAAPRRPLRRGDDAQSGRRSQRFTGDAAEVTAPSALDDDDAGVDADPHGQLLVGQLADRQGREHGPLDRPLGGGNPKHADSSSPDVAEHEPAALDEPGPGGAAEPGRDRQLHLRVDAVDGRHGEGHRDHADAPPLALAARAVPGVAADSSWRRIRPSSSRSAARARGRAPHRAGGAARGTSAGRRPDDRRGTAPSSAGRRTPRAAGWPRRPAAARPARRAVAGAPAARTAPAGRPAAGRRVGPPPASGRGTRAGRRRRRPATVRGRRARWRRRRRRQRWPRPPGRPPRSRRRPRPPAPGRGGSRRPRCGWRRPARRAPGAAASRRPGSSCGAALAARPATARRSARRSRRSRPAAPPADRARGAASDRRERPGRPRT